MIPPTPAANPERARLLKRAPCSAGGRSQLGVPNAGLRPYPRGTLEQLDEYEEHPVEYIRTQIKLSDGSLAETYIFQANEKNYPKILSGDWVNRPRPQPELYKSLDEMLDEHKN